MAFTSGSDYNILQVTDELVVGAGAGDDTYIVSTVTIGANQTMTISDTLGTNTLQLVDGLSITSSRVTNNAVELTLSNNAVIKVLEADDFNFDVGGNALVGPGDVQDFETFVTTTLGIDAVPAAGSMATGGSVTIGETIDPGNIIDLQEGSTAPVDATDAADIFTFDAAVALADAHGTTTQININGFDTAADSLRLDLTTAIGETTLDQLAGVEDIVVQTDPFAGNTMINFGNDANGGELVVLGLVGVCDPTQVNIDIV